MVHWITVPLCPPVSLPQSSLLSTPSKTRRNPAFPGRFPVPPGKWKRRLRENAPPRTAVLPGPFWQSVSARGPHANSLLAGEYQR